MLEAAASFFLVRESRIETQSAQKHEFVGRKPDAATSSAAAAVDLRLRIKKPV